VGRWVPLLPSPLPLPPSVLSFPQCVNDCPNTVRLALARPKVLCTVSYMLAQAYHSKPCRARFGFTSDNTLLHMSLDVLTYQLHRRHCRCMSLIMSLCYCFSFVASGCRYLPNSMLPSTCRHSTVLCFRYQHSLFTSQVTWAKELPACPVKSPRCSYHDAPQPTSLQHQLPHPSPRLPSRPPLLDRSRSHSLTTHHSASISLFFSSVSLLSSHPFPSILLIPASPTASSSLFPSSSISQRASLSLFVCCLPAYALCFPRPALPVYSILRAPPLTPSLPHSLRPDSRPHAPSQTQRITAVFVIRH
jgi:hypothetical protein